MFLRSNILNFVSKSLQTVPPAMNLHHKCTVGSYPKSDVARLVNQIDWAIEDKDYSPLDYTAPSILRQPPYADKPSNSRDFNPKWNSVDGKVNRCSHEGEYAIVGGVPRNPHGRTGITGRGLLGRWGPNHAADPIVTRWRREANGEKHLHSVSGKPVLQFVCILRHDGGGWAIPGGMVDPGEVVSATLRREFMEEALNSNEMTQEQKNDTRGQLEELFNSGEDVYRGYVDDPRNTDNAWMETVAQNFHQDDAGGILDKLRLNAGDDAAAVRWQDISSELLLYASHSDMIRRTAERRGAHW